MTEQLTNRPLGSDDLAAVLALMTATDLAVVGFRDFTDDEIAAELARGDVEHHGWYVGPGTLAGYAWVERIERSDQVEMDVYVHPDHDAGLGAVIVDWLTDRGRALAAAAGHDHVRLGLGVFRQDERTRTFLVAAGFEVGTTFTRMRIDLDGPALAPAPAGAVTLREAAGSEQDRRVAYRISEDSFVDHYGHVETSYDTFLRRLAERGEGFTSVWLGELDGDPVGVLVASRLFEQDQNAGYVRTLGVLPAARGRGVAKALLRTYFDSARRAGRAAVLLHVDVANVTGALRLYESVGMRTVMEIDAWAKRVAVAGPRAPARRSSG